MSIEELLKSPRETRQCGKHGPYESEGCMGGKYWTPCPSCREEQRAEAEAELKRERHQQLQRQLVRASGIIGRFLQASLDNYEATSQPQQRVLAACQRFIETFPSNEGQGLIFLGKPGTGKTHLASAIALSIIEKHARSVHVATATEIVRELRSTWHKRAAARTSDPWAAAETEEDIIERFGNYALLVLDEVGGGFGTDGERAQLFEVLDLRYRLQHPTIVCSNLNTNDLRDALGERSFDRICDGAQRLAMAWESHRRLAS